MVCRLVAGITKPILRQNEKSGEAVSECENKRAYQVERQVKLTCWNCRGLSNSVPYLNSMIDERSSVIVLSEHWLWPYKLQRLEDIHPDFNWVGKSDARLS